MNARTRLFFLFVLLSLAAAACRAGNPTPDDGAPSDLNATVVPTVAGPATSAPDAPAGADQPTQPAPTAVVLDPVVFTFDVASAAAAPIGPEGGTLEATGADGTRYMLVVPAEALDFTEVLTLTPVSDVTGLPLAAGMAGSVRLEPEGLPFFVPAVLTIEPAGSLADDVAGFAYNGDGAEFHLRALATGGGGGALFKPADGLAQSVPVARGYGLASVTAGEAALLANQPLADAGDVTEAQGLASEYTELFTHAAAARSQWENSIEPKLIDLQATVDPTPEAVDALSLEIDRWLAFINYWGLDEELSNEVANATEQIVVYGLAPTSEAAYHRCVSEKRPEEAFRLVRWRRYALKYMPDSTVPADVEQWITNCLTFKLKFHSVITEASEGYGYYYEMGSDVTLQAHGTMRATGMGDLDWIDLHWIGNDNCAVAMTGDGAEFDLENDDLGLTISPVSRMSPAVNMTLRYYPGTPAEYTTMSCPGADPINWHTNGWETYFVEMHEPDLTDTGYMITSQIVGAGSFEGWIVQNTTTGPGGQAVEENTEFELQHTPK